MCQGSRISRYSVLINRRTYDGCFVLPIGQNKSSAAGNAVTLLIMSRSRSSLWNSRRPFCNNDKQKQRRDENEFLCSWSTAYASLSPRPTSREAQGKEGSDLFTIPGSRTLFPSIIIIIREVQGAGRSWLDGQTGWATLWRGADLLKLEWTENQHTLQTKE